MPQATAYTQLVGVAAGAITECKTATTPRVQPADPMGSLLYLKLANMQTCGMRMPPTGDRITAAMLDRLREWITAGAPNN